MEDMRDGDLRVPLISTIFFIFVLTGGIFLVLYVFAPEISQPWFPVVALLLIGSPWIFWFLTYMYTCIKACCRGNRIQDRQISRHGTSMQRTTTTNTNPAVGRSALSPDESGANSPNGGERHVHFGEVVMVQGEESRGHDSVAESSVNSSKEIEMPLNLSASS